MATGSITPVMVDALRGTKPWTMLIGILLFIMSALLVLGGIGGVIAMTAAMSAESGGMSGGIVAAVGAFYLVLAAIYIFLGLYLVKYSSAIGTFLSAGQSTDMESALQQQQKFWKLSGILSIVMIVVFVLAIVAAIALPALMMSQGGGLQ
jgi:hypothetical protein